MQNPLLEQKSLPLFKHILAKDAVPAITTIIEENQAAIEFITKETQPSWETVIQPLEDMANRLENAWSPIRHLNSVANNAEIRAAYQTCLDKLSLYHSELEQNPLLFQLFTTLKEKFSLANLSSAKQKVITDALLHFKLAGVHLSQDKKKRYQEIQQTLATLATTFENNLLDATAAWSITIGDKADLAGLPEHAIIAARKEAEKRGVSGFVFTLEYPSYYAIITYADSRTLRQTLYEAYITRASDKGPHASKWDNSVVMEEILALRHELAILLGFKHYAEYSLATKMVKSPAAVMHFLEDLVTKARPLALSEIETLRQFAHETYQLDTLEAWDIAYMSEKLKQTAYEIDDEALRPYFPEQIVLNGLFTIVNKLYDIQIVQKHDIETWHEDVKVYQIVNAKNEPVAIFYLDLYARPYKRGGAWMDDCRARHRDSRGSLQLPATYLTCNFTKPQSDQGALFTHTEVLTLFHEFGHGLHHMLTTMDTISISGINGVEWDAVELPSQFMENFCWEHASLALISGHYKTGEPIPDVLYKKMIKAKNFHNAMMIVRQLEFALFDFRLHMEYIPGSTSHFIQEILDEVRLQVSVVPYPLFNRFQHGFSHIFAGGYAAGYYSYKWAEVLSSDAYSFFEEKGILSREAGAAFLEKLLSQGGSKPAAELFREFRGREPSIEPYLRHHGLG